MKRLLIVAVILLCLQALDAMPNVNIPTVTKSVESSSSSGRDGGLGSTITTTTFLSSTDGSSKQTTTTVTKSLSSSSSSSSVELLGLVGYDVDDCGDCDCSCGCYNDPNYKFEITEKVHTCSGSTEMITEVTKKLQAALDESAKLKTQLIAVSADGQKCKSRTDSLEIDLKTTKEINVKQTLTVNEYTATITNLRTTITAITNKSNKCGSESDEWQRKWQTENAKVIKNEKTIKTLEASNDDLKLRISSLTVDLKRCQKTNQQNDVEVNKLKKTVTDLKNDLSNCTINLGTCNGALKSTKDAFDADKLSDLEEVRKRAKIELELSECTARRKDVETNYESEKKLVISCKSEIVTIREECSKRYQKYENDLAELKLSCKSSTDKCEATLKSERDNSTKISIQITTLENRIVEIENRLTISVKASDDWQKKHKYCEDNSITLKQTIETLRTNIADTNNHLSTCVANSNTLQSELTSCKSKSETCTGELTQIKIRIADSESVVVNLNSRIGTIESAKNRCLVELSSLRCDVNQYLGDVKAAEEKAYESVLQVLSILDGKKKSIGKFVGSHNITCSG